MFCFQRMLHNCRCVKKLFRLVVRLLICFRRQQPWLGVIFLSCFIRRWCSVFSVALMLEIIFFNFLFSFSRYSISSKIVAGICCVDDCCEKEMFPELCLKLVLEMVDFKL